MDKEIRKIIIIIIAIANMIIIIVRYLTSISEDSYDTINIFNISMIILFLISVLLIVFSKKASENKKLMVVVIIIYFLIIFFVPMYTVSPMDTGGIAGTWYRSYKNIYGFSLYSKEMGDANLPYFMK